MDEKVSDLLLYSYEAVYVGNENEYFVNILVYTQPRFDSSCVHCRLVGLYKTYRKQVRGQVAQTPAERHTAKEDSRNLNNIDSSHTASLQNVEF